MHLPGGKAALLHHIMEKHPNAHVYLHTLNPSPFPNMCDLFALVLRFNGVDLGLLVVFLAISLGQTLIRTTIIPIVLLDS